VTVRLGLVLLALVAVGEAPRARAADGAGSALDAEVRAFIDRWLSVQNGGDFTAYQSLYAARFTGVRRSGPRVVRFDRPGWMKDRQRMFAKKMTVAAEGTAIAASSQSARVTFVQSFAQGNWRDEGDKQIVLVREGGVLKIAQEEMLSSRVGAHAAPDATAATPREQFAWTVDGNIVLDDAPGEVGRGKIEMHEGPITTVVRAVDSKRLPPEIMAWKGRAVTAFNLDGDRCDAKVTGFQLIGKVTPHFGTVEEWRNQSPARVAADAWQLADKVLVGVLEGCDGAAWARAASLPAPKVVTGHEPDPELRAAALEKFRALPEWKQIQQAYLVEPAKGVARWEDYPDGKSSTEVAAFDVTVHGTSATYVSVSSAVYTGCAEFAGDLWALYRVDRSKNDKSGRIRLTPKNSPGHGTVKPAAFVDSDGDGEPELLFDGGAAGDLGTERGRVKPVDGKYDDFEKLAWPYLDCPC
jgi:hypothetical protein